MVSNRRPDDGQQSEQRDMFEVRDAVPSQPDTDGRAEAELRVHSVRDESRRGESSPGPRDGERRRESPDGRFTKPELSRHEKLTRLSKTCDVCGYQFRVDKSKGWKNRCGECAPIMREAMIPCAGCGVRFRYARLHLVSSTFTPGKRGGKKIQLRYCNGCLSSLSAMFTKQQAVQGAAWKDAALDQREYVRMISR